MPRKSRGPHLFIRERNDGESVWYIRDKRKRISTGIGGGDTERARAALGAYIAKTATPNFGDGDPNRVKVGAVIALYARDKVAGTARPKETVARLKRLNGFFGDDFVFSITPPRCKAYVASRGAVQGARRELEDLRAAIKYAYNSRLLTVPVPVDMPAKAEPRERWLTRREAARLLLGALGFKLARRQMSHSGSSNDAEKWDIVGRPGERNRHVARFILLGLYTGTRHDAILGLGWLPQIDGGHVDLEQGLIYRRGAGERVTKKRRPPVPIDERLAAHLRRWSKMPASGRYVVTYDGSRMDRMQRGWRSARKLAGLDESVTPHVLRHTFVSWQLQAGEPVWKVAGRAGMEPQMVEKTYGHHGIDYLRTKARERG